MEPEFYSSKKREGIFLSSFCESEHVCGGKDRRGRVSWAIKGGTWAFKGESPFRKERSKKIRGKVLSLGCL